ncbi:hypothetical protein CRUP_001561 [Coryphaenoides rupestris]|nr:hypothetical protein CRUP_001561 [Coryphaenoides rupestris]
MQEQVEKPRRDEDYITAAVALSTYSEHLTPFERDEIRKYKEVWYLGLGAKKVQATNCNDYAEKGRYKMVIKDHIDYRYEILEPLGEGWFGQVFKCLDHKTKQQVAMKAMDEVNILAKLQAKKDYKNGNIINMKAFFVFRTHLCITFDLMGNSLYDLIPADKGLGIDQVRRYAISILHSLQFLSKEHIIHSDIKPENILVSKDDPEDIKACIRTKPVPPSVVVKKVTIPTDKTKTPQEAPHHDVNTACIRTKPVPPSVVVKKVTIPTDKTKTPQEAPHHDVNTESSRTKYWTPSCMRLLLTVSPDMRLYMEYTILPYGQQKQQHQYPPGLVFPWIQSSSSSWGTLLNSPMMPHWACRAAMMHMCGVRKSLRRMMRMASTEKATSCRPWREARQWGSSQQGGAPVSSSSQPTGQHATADNSLFNASSAFTSRRNLSTGARPSPLLMDQHILVGTPRKSMRPVYVRYPLARTT